MLRFWLQSATGRYDGEAGQEGNAQASWEELQGYRTFYETRRYRVTGCDHAFNQRRVQHVL